MPSNRRHETSRRTFLKSAVAAPLVLAAGSSAQVPAPSNRITIGSIGLGTMGNSDLRGFLGDDRVQVVAVCDVNEGAESGYWGNAPGGLELGKNAVEGWYGRRNRSGTYHGCDTYTDFRELLARDDIDAVVIAVPDHWHALPAVTAARSGKDIYGEKPLALTVAEGRLMSDEVRKYNRIFQCGSQQRSDSRFRLACELVRNGRIGNLKTVKCGLPGGTPDINKNAHRTEPEPVPNGFDWNFWLGPAPDAPYSPARAHVNWRWVLDYSGGQVTDWGGHHPDIAQWGMNTEHTGPIRIQNARATYAQHPVYNTATDFYFESVYENGVILTVSNSERGGVTFEGTEGWVWVDRGKIEAHPATLLDTEIGGNEVHLYESKNHLRNFIDCVISREQPIAPIETAHRSITIAHLGNIAMKLGRDLQWDPAAERFVNDDEANGRLSRPYREPWHV